MKLTHKRRRLLRAVASQFLLGIAGLALITFVCFHVGFGIERTGLAYLTLIALLSLLGSFAVSIAVSIVAVGCLNYFFVQPLFDFRVDDPDDIVRLAAFLITSLVITTLTTKLKRTQVSLAASNAKLEEAQRIASVGWWERDFSTGHVALSDEVCRIFGLLPVDLPEWHGRWLTLIHPEDRPRADKAAAAALLPGGPRYDLEYRVVRRDGTERIVHSQGDVTWDETGQPLRQFGVLQDITELRQAEQELRASEARFRTIVDYASDAFFVLDDNSTVVDVNREACRSLGYSREELIGKHRSDFDVSVDEASAQRLKQHIVSGQAITFESRHRRKEGTTFPVEIRVGEFEQDGERRFLCLVRDITERKQAEETLRRTETYLAAAESLSKMGSWAWRPAANEITHWSPGRYRLFGFDPADGVPSLKAVIERIHPEDRALWLESRSLVARGGESDFDFRIVLPDGGTKHVHAVGRPILNQSGEVVEVMGAAADVTDRKQAEEALRRTQAYLIEAQRLSHIGTWAFDKTATLYWSEETYRLAGLDPAQGPPTRESMRQRIHPDDRSRVYEELKKAVDQKRNFAMEFRVVLPDGRVRHLENTGHPIFSAGGDFIEMVGSTIDVTERRRAEQEHERLRQLESELAHVGRLSMMGELTASLAHEILHPIGTARNNARVAIRFLNRSPPDLNEVRGALENIVRDADRGKAIVDRVRDHIKKSPPRTDHFDLNGAIAEVIEMVRGAIDHNRVSVRTGLAPALTSVWGDRVQLQQVVMNLVLNAVEAMGSVEERARFLSIKTEQNGQGGVLVEVRDSGPGMDAEHLEKVFNPFFTTKPSGVGMGLAICRSIIDAHGGKLWAENNEPRGAVFRFTLPPGSDSQATAQ